MRELPDQARDLIGEILNARGPEQYHARLLHQSRGDLDEYHLEVDKDAQAWFLHQVGSDHTAEYVDGALRLPDGPLEVPFGEASPAPLRLAFPRMLRCWGRRGDESEPVMVEELGTHSILVTFQMRIDPATRGTVVFDRALGLVRKMITPYAATTLDRVEPGMPFVRDTSRQPTFAGYENPDY